MLVIVGLAFAILLGVALIAAVLVLTIRSIRRWVIRRRRRFAEIAAAAAEVRTRNASAADTVDTQPQQ